MEPIALYPVRKSTGEIVYPQLEAAAPTIGVPRAIVSDHGPDRQAGIRQFCEAHSTPCAIYDITHQAASLVKDFLTDDDTWETFCRFATQMKSQVQQTDLAPVAPPTQRTKARYMHVDALGRWAEQVLRIVEEDVIITETTPLSMHPGAEKVTWVDTFREAIADWSAVFEVVALTERCVRQYGFQSLGVERLEAQIYAVKWLPHVSNFAEALLDFGRKESAKASSGDRLVGSSEVIESVFGKLKQIEGAQSKQGFTGLLVSAAALVASTTLDVVRKAMETISTTDGQTWGREALETSVQAQRQALFASNAIGTKIEST